MSPVQWEGVKCRYRAGREPENTKSNMEEGVLKPAAITQIFDILLIETLQV